MPVYVKLVYSGLSAMTATLDSSDSAIPDASLASVTTTPVTVTLSQVRKPNPHCHLQAGKIFTSTL